MQVAAAKIGATVTVYWGRGDEVEASIYLTPRDWARVEAGKPLNVRGKGYWYEGERYQDHWSFSGGLDGELLVEYGDDGAVGFVGMLSVARIVENKRTETD